MPYDIQSRLLRVLQFGEFTRVGGREVIKTDVRIISATNKNIKSLIEKGEFREDLFYRLNVINIFLPPLRERENDIIALGRHYLNLYSDGKKQFDSSAINFLKSHLWPGNVRELENLLKRTSVLTSDTIVSSEVLKDYVDYDKFEPLQKKEIKNAINEKDNLRSYLDIFLKNFFDSLDSNDQKMELHDKFMDEFERPLILKSLEFCKGNQIKTSQILGINRNTLRSKLKKLNISSKYGKK